MRTVHRQRLDLTVVFLIVILWQSEFSKNETNDYATAFLFDIM